jgi:hypothetical protein
MSLVGPVIALAAQLWAFCAPMTRRAGSPSCFVNPALLEDAAELVISASSAALVAAQLTIPARATMGSFTAGAWRRVGDGGGW